MSPGFLFGCRMSQGLSGTAMPLRFVCTCMYEGTCLPTWSSIWINGGTSFSALPLVSGVSWATHAHYTWERHVYSLFQNRYFPKRAGMEKPLSDAEPREFRAVMDGWRSPCRGAGGGAGWRWVCVPAAPAVRGRPGPGPACAAGGGGVAPGEAPTATGRPWIRLAERPRSANPPCRGCGRRCPAPCALGRADGGRGCGPAPRRVPAAPRPPLRSRRLPPLPPASPPPAPHRRGRSTRRPPEDAPRFCSPAAGRAGAAGPGWPRAGQGAAAGPGRRRRGRERRRTKAPCKMEPAEKGWTPALPAAHPPARLPGLRGGGIASRCRRRGVGRQRGWSRGRRGALSRAWGRRGAAEVAARGRGGSVKHFPLLSVSLWEDSRPDSVDVPLPVPSAPHPSSARQPTQEGVSISPLPCAGEVADMPAAGSRCTGGGGEPDLKGNCAADNAQQQHLEQPWGPELRFWHCCTHSTSRNDSSCLEWLQAAGRSMK